MMFESCPSITCPCLQHTCLGYPVQAYRKTAFYVTVTDLRNLIAIWEMMHLIGAYVSLSLYSPLWGSHSSSPWQAYSQLSNKQMSQPFQHYRDTVQLRDWLGLAGAQLGSKYNPFMWHTSRCPFYEHVQPQPVLLRPSSNAIAEIPIAVHY